MGTNIDLKIDGKTAVSVPTKELAAMVLDVLKSLDGVWDSGLGYSPLDCWDIYGRETCYLIPECRGNTRQFFEDKGYDFISAERFIELHTSLGGTPVRCLRRRIFVNKTPSSLEISCNRWLGDNDVEVKDMQMYETGTLKILLVTYYDGGQVGDNSDNDKRG